MANLFTYNSTVGIIAAGVPVAIDMLTDNFGHTQPPHVQIGSRFINLDRYNKPTLCGDRLHDAVVTEYTPLGKEKPFPLLSKWEDGDERVYVLVDGDTPEHVRSRIDGDVVGAWYGVLPYGAQVIESDRRAGSYLLKFEEGCAADVCTADGLVHRLRMQRGTIKCIPLTPREMAEVRVRKFRADLDGLGDDVKRRHGLFGGVIRLLLRTGRYPEARRVLVGFLEDHVEHLTDSMRRDIKLFLDACGYPAAATFTPGEILSNVVLLHPNGTKGKPSGKRLADIKKAKKSDESKEIRNMMKGRSGQQGDNKRNSKKK